MIKFYKIISVVYLITGAFLFVWNQKFTSSQFENKLYTLIMILGLGISSVLFLLFATFKNKNVKGFIVIIASLVYMC
jgi:hypothetical protein